MKTIESLFIFCMYGGKIDDDVDEMIPFILSICWQDGM